METLTGFLDVSEIKRGYTKLPISYICPICKTELHNDLWDGDNYIEYPGHEDEVQVTHFFCEKCYKDKEKQFEYELPIKIIKTEIVIEFDRDKIKGV